MPEIATGINALAMTGVVDGRQHLANRAININLKCAGYVYDFAAWKNTSCSAKQKIMIS